MQYGRLVENRETITGCSIKVYFGTFSLIFWWQAIKHESKIVDITNILQNVVLLCIMQFCGCTYVSVCVCVCEYKDQQMFVSGPIFSMALADCHQVCYVGTKLMFFFIGMFH